MGRFGFNKKGDGDEDSNKLALFGSRNKSKSPAPPANNPYAAAPPDPYTQAKINAGVIPSPQGTPRQGGYGSRETLSRPPEYEQSAYGRTENATSGYKADKYGNDAGYGGSSGRNPYVNASQTSGTSKQGGYGGLGRTNSYDTTTTDVNRDALFGGARDRVQQQQTRPPGYTYDDASDPNEAKSYGAYGDRQLTAEEEEEEDINAMNQERKYIKQQTVASSRNALRVAEQAEETARNTLARLGAQGERLHNTKRNLDLAQSQVTEAQDKTSELQRLNRSMFIPASNPFQSKGAKERRDQRIMERHQKEREIREDTRASAFRSEQRKQQDFKELGASARGPVKVTPNLAERTKYQFDADSEEDADDDEIDRNTAALERITGTLHQASQRLGAEIDSQNELIEGIKLQTDEVDDQVHMETARLRRIK